MRCVTSGHIGRGLQVTRLAESAQCDVVDDLFDLLDVVLDRVHSLAQKIVLEIEQSVAGVQIGNKLRDLSGQRELFGDDTVDGEARLDVSYARLEAVIVWCNSTYEFVGQISQADEVVFEFECKGVDTLRLARH